MGATSVVVSPSQSAKPSRSASTWPPAARGTIALTGCLHVERPVGARLRVEAVHEPGHDVDPQELAAARVPERPFAEIRARVEDEVGLPFLHHWREYAGRGRPLLSLESWDACCSSSCRACTPRSIARAAAGSPDASGKLDVLLLTTTGRKTGKPRTVPLLYAPAGNGYAVIGSKGGAVERPRVGAQPAREPRRPGRARRQAASQSKRAKPKARSTSQLWNQMAQGYKGYAGYKEKTSRRIPVFVLEP